VKTSPTSFEKSDYLVDQRLLKISALAFAIGGISTVAAFVLLGLIRLCTNLFFFQTVSFVERSPATNHLGAWVIAVPAIGGLIVGLMARYGSEKIRGHGIPEAMEAILFNKSKMSPRVALLKPLSSGIVIGSGGPFGAEGPIIMTGGSLASLLAQYLHVTAAERKALLVAGACAGMTAIFGTPVAAVLLAVELLLFELRPRSLLPVALACATAGFLRPLLFDSSPLFALQTPAVTTSDLLSCLVAGIFSGVLTLMLTHALHSLEAGFARLPLHWMWWPALGGIIVGIGGYFEPRALGVGYSVIDDLLHNNLALTAVITLFSVKAVIWLIALASGTSGGVLAPLLTLGAALGLLLAPYLGGSPSLWALACMAAVLGSSLGAPLTAAVFAFGLTHDSEALLPLLLTTAVAYGLTVLTMRRSIMTEKISRRGLHIYREYSVDPLERQHIADLMTRDVETIDGDVTLETAIGNYFTEHSPHRAYPVIKDGRLLGMLTKHLLRDITDTRITCARLFTTPDASQVLVPQLTARAAAGRMAKLDVSRLPVVLDTHSMQLVGIVSVRDLLRPNHTHFEEENLRERLR